MRKSRAFQSTRYLRLNGKQELHDQVQLLLGEHLQKRKQELSDYQTARKDDCTISKQDVDLLES